MAKKTIHVVPSPAGGWNVRRGGAERASKHFEKQEQAAKYARKVSKDEHGELYIHRRDGTVREKDSHGNDPYRPLLRPDSVKPAVSLETGIAG